MPPFIVSLTTYPKRMDYFKKSFSHLMTLSKMDLAEKIVVVLDDNLKDEDYASYDSFLSTFSDGRIETMRSAAKWRSANKLVPVYNAYGQTHAIVTFDDDKDYPEECLAQLLDGQAENPDCIIAQEINPSFVRGPSVGFVNGIDVKLRQVEWGKYLSNACLFPQKCFGDGTLINDFDGFMYVTKGTHDELWFWIVSTICGFQCVGLDYTYSYAMDDGVTYELDETSLSHINVDGGNVNGYNERTTERYGREMLAAIGAKPVSFKATFSNFSGMIHGLPAIHALYDGQPIEFRFDKSLPHSFIRVFANSVRRFEWHSAVNVFQEGE